jgi:hypothetical protein
MCGLDGIAVVCGIQELFRLVHPRAIVSIAPATSR